MISNIRHFEHLEITKDPDNILKDIIQKGI